MYAPQANLYRDDYKTKCWRVHVRIRFSRKMAYLRIIFYFRHQKNYYLADKKLRWHYDNE